MRIHGDRLSGNCHKVLLTAELLGLDYECLPLDVVAGDTQQPAFLAKNPVGKMPLLELDDSRCLSESNAIVNFLAEGSALMPTDAFARAKVQQWQFYEQYSHEPFIAVARFIKRYLGTPEARRAEFEGKQAGGRAQGARGHGKRAVGFAVSRRQCGHGRRHLALRLHARGQRRRLRTLGLSRGERMDQAHTHAARFRGNGTKLIREPRQRWRISLLHGEDGDSLSVFRA